MAYDSTTGIITAPVSMDDIGAALGSSSKDLGTLCRDAAVNKWARYKSVRFRTLGTTGRTSGSSYWKGDDAATSPYLIGGLAAPYAPSLGTLAQDTTTGKITSSSGFLRDLIHGDLAWSRAVPTGGVGSSDWSYRMLDFDGYLRDAVSPMPSPPSGSYGFGQTWLRTMTLGLPTISNDRNLSLDIMEVPTAVSTLRPVLSQFYAGLVFYKSDYSDLFWKTAQRPLSDTSVEEYRRKVSIATRSASPWLTSREGAWKCRVFLSSVGGLDSDDSTTWGATGIFLPGDTLVGDVTLFNVTGDCSIEITMAKWVASQGSPTVVNTSVTLHNGTVDTVQVSDASVGLVNGLGITVATDTVPSQSLASGASYVHLHQFTQLVHESLTLRASAHFGSLTITEESPIEQ